MRIALVGGGVKAIPPTGYGAVERIVAELADGLRAAGDDVVVVNEVRYGRTRDEYPFALDVPGMLAREGPFDVVHVHTPVVAARLAWSGVPYLYTSHSRHWFYRERLTHWWGYWLEMEAVRHAKAVAALTGQVADAMGRAVRHPAPVSVIPFGVDTVKFRPGPSRKDGKVALGVGVVLPFKRWHLAARALKGTGVKLRIVGPIPSPKYASEVVEAGDDVMLLGEVSPSDLLAWYQDSDFLIHPSRVELLSAAVLEGLSSGLPVVGGQAAASAAGMAWVGRTPIPNDERGLVESMRNAAIALATDEALRTEKSLSARRIAESVYAWPKVVERHRAWYAGA